MSLKRKNLIILLCVFALFFTPGDVQGDERKIPDYVIKCSLSAPAEISACVQNNAEIFRPKMAQGIPEFHIPPMEPLIVENVVIALPNFRAEFDNCSLTGGSNFDVLNVMFDYQKLMITLTSRFRLLHLKARYHFSGKLLMLQLESQGMGALETNNVDVFVEMHAKIRETQDKKFMDFSNRSQQKIKLTFNNKPMLYFENLISKNEELTRTTNAILNDNIIEIMTDYMPLLEEVASTYVFTIVQTTFDSFSVDELFLP